MVQDIVLMKYSALLLVWFWRNLYTIRQKLVFNKESVDSKVLAIYEEIIHNSEIFASTAVLKRSGKIWCLKLWLCKYFHFLHGWSQLQSD